ncbi:MAG: DUF418 domain-containing protein [Arenimonas sp.]
MTASVSITHAGGLAPIGAAERIHALDIIRGLALIGIFLMNVEWFTRPLAEFGTGVDVNQHGLSYLASWFIYTFVQGKFWTMFSLLFGMGFAVMLTRAQEGDRAFAVPYMRRIAGLFAFGCAHFVLVWTGDILHNYAAAALFLLLIVTRSWLGWLATLLSVVAIGYGFGVEWLLVSLGFVAAAVAAGWMLRRTAIDRWYKMIAPVGLAALAAASLAPTSPDMAATAAVLALVAILLVVLERGTLARYWKWGVGMFVLPLLVVLVAIGVFSLKPELMPGQGPDAAQHRAEATVERAKDRAEQVTVFTTGSYGDSLAWRAKSFREELPGTAAVAVFALAMFLIGFWFVRSGVVRAWREHLPLFRRLLGWSLPVGLAITLASVGLRASFVRGLPPSNLSALAGTLFELGSLPLCIGYASGIFCLLGTRLGAMLLSPLRHAGRMALTNYLGASVIGTLYFSGYGLGHFGQVSRAGQVLFVAVVFAAQLAFSAAWLAKFRYGPMEWLWRAITYWRLPPMRLGDEAATPSLAVTGSA